MNQTQPLPNPGSMVSKFPQPGRLLEQAYRELNIAVNGTNEQRKELGDPKLLPRPWDPDSLPNQRLRRELWIWLEAFASWLNTEYVWDVAGDVPPCWPQHPHLVRELAVLADQRRSAGRSMSSDALEEWHRYALPAFVDRMRHRLKSHCEDGHQQWPAKGRHARYLGEPASTARKKTFDQDFAAHHQPLPPDPQSSSGPQLRVVLDGQTVNTSTGEVTDK